MSTPTAEQVEALRRAWYEAALLAARSTPKPGAQVLAVAAWNAYEDARWGSTT
jgi:hypothetical protein